MEDARPAKLAYSTFKPKDSADTSLSPVIFLHGLCGNKEQWADVPQRIADETKRMCYAIDARNHGDSEYINTTHMDLNTIDLINFLDCMHIPKAILVGLSMGGCTVIGAALSKPERVEKIVSVEMHTKQFDKEHVDIVAAYSKSWRDAVQELPKGLSLEEAITRALDVMFNKLPSNTLIPSKDKMRGVGKNIIQKPDGTFDVKYNKDAISETLKNYKSIRSEYTGKFEGPAKFIYGEISPLYVGRDEANIRKHFPNVEIVEFKGATHAIPYECPEQFFEHLLNFLLK